MGEVMPLTPEDVSNKRFTPVRLREGYDMGEVDQFLDEVEAELARLTKENDDLRQKLAAAQTGGGSSFQDNPPTAQTPAVQEPIREPEPTPPPAPEPTPEPVAAAAAPETIRVETVPQASNAAARLTELAKEVPGRVLTCAETLAEADDAESAHWRTHNTVTLRGRSAETELLVRACEHLAELLAGLHDRSGLQERILAIKAVEDEADVIARAARASLFKDDGIDPMVVIRWKDIFETLEQSIDACEKVAHVLEGISLKRKSSRRH